MGENLDPLKYVCKKEESTIDGMKGYYFGEFDIATNLPHGRGIFKVCWDPSWVKKLFLGYFEDGKFGEGDRISVDFG